MFSRKTNLKTFVLMIKIWSENSVAVYLSFDIIAACFIHSIHSALLPFMKEF